MSNYHFGDDYDLNYYPPEASDGMGGVDWDKVERVEIEYDIYVKERTCKLEPLEAFYVTVNMLDQTEWGVCSNCGTASPIDATYCCECGAKVVDERECNTCIHYEDASRYDPDDESELYTLMKCNLHGHVTDWPCACEDWEGVEE